LSGLFETIFVHAMIRLDKTVLALEIDGVFRKMLPFALYPCLVIGWVFKGLDLTILWMIFSFGGSVICIGMGFLYSHQNFRRTQLKREKVIKDLKGLHLEEKRAAMDDEQTTKTMRAAFDCFDLDKSRKLEKREVRLILGAMYPSLSRKQALQAMSAVKEDEIPFEDFAEVVETWHSIKHDAELAAPPRKRVTLLERLGFRKKMKKGFEDIKRKTSVVNAFKASGNAGAASKLKSLAKASSQAEVAAPAPQAQGAAAAMFMAFKKTETTDEAGVKSMEA